MRVLDFTTKLQLKLKIFMFEGLLRPVRPAGMVRFGSYYGGWWVQEVDPAQGAAFCVGAGTDVTFDLELQRLGYRVYTVDPTPSAVEYVEKSHPELTFIPVGVWHESGDLQFEQNPEWTEVWAIGAAKTQQAGPAASVQTLPVLTVKDLFDSTGEQRVAILKLDIEGAEHDVIRSMIRDAVRPRCLCVEFDDHRTVRVISTTRALRRYGYDLYQIEGLNFTFVQR
jgi:FkbM family methyltransferase